MMKKKIAAYLLLLSFGLMLYSFFSKIYVLSYLAFFSIFCACALTLGGQPLRRSNGTELLEMAVSIIGSSGFFILALLGVGSGKTSIIIASVGGLVVYYWSYVRIFPKEMRRSILSRK